MTSKKDERCDVEIIEGQINDSPEIPISGKKARTKEIISHFLLLNGHLKKCLI